MKPAPPVISNFFSYFSVKSAIQGRSVILESKVIYLVKNPYLFTTRVYFV